MPLEQAFALTPRESYLYTGSGHRAQVYVHGVSNAPKLSPTYRFAFDNQHTSDELFFATVPAGNTATNYASWIERASSVEMPGDHSE